MVNFEEYTVEKKINIQQVLFFFLKKAKPKKQKKNIYISYLITVLSKYRLACKYGITFQISISN